jgi:hypothetical protein
MALQYIEAGEIVDAVLSDKTSLKSALYSRGRQTQLGKLMALVTQTLKCSLRPFIYASSSSISYIFIYLDFFFSHSCVRFGRFDCIYAASG